jgi:hypothetical protein
MNRVTVVSTVKDTAQLLKTKLEIVVPRGGFELLIEVFALIMIEQPVVSMQPRKPSESRPSQPTVPAFYAIYKDEYAAYSHNFDCH